METSDDGKATMERVNYHFLIYQNRSTRKNLY